MNMLLEIIGTIIALLFLYTQRNKGKERIEDPATPIEKPKPVIDIYVLQIDDIYYAWENNVKFLFQHKDPNEVAKMLIRKYPNHKLNINEKLT